MHQYTHVHACMQRQSRCVAYLSFHASMQPISPAVRYTLLLLSLCGDPHSFPSIHALSSRHRLDAPFLRWRARSRPQAAGPRPSSRSLPVHGPRLSTVGPRRGGLRNARTPGVRVRGQAVRPRHTGHNQTGSNRLVFPCIKVRVSPYKLQYLNRLQIICMDVKGEERSGTGLGWMPGASASRQDR